MNAATFDAVSGIALFAIACLVYVFGLSPYGLTRGPLRRRRVKLDPIEDMAQWKHQRRLDDTADWQARYDQLLGPEHRCPCGWISHGTVDAEQHRIDHAWEVSNLGKLPEGYITLWRRAKQNV